MRMTRRDFIRTGAAAFTVGWAAPAFLTDACLAQSDTGRSLVVLYLSGGNDALSMLVPYTDAAYYARRSTLAVPAGEVLQVGTDRAGHALGFHPRLRGLHRIFNDGTLAVVQRTGYPDSSRSHFEGRDVWSTASPTSPQGPGWLGRYLDVLPSPVDPLVGWATTLEPPRALVGRTVAVPAIPDVETYAFNSPNEGAEAQLARVTASGISSHVPVGAPHLAFVNGTTQAALATLDRVAGVAGYTPTTAYPSTGLARAFKAVAGAMSQSIGTRVFWVQATGYDTHANQDTSSGRYLDLMADLDEAVGAFYDDLRNQALLNQTLVVAFSEFGRRIDENGSRGTDHGSGGLMLVLGGGVRGGLHGTAASLAAGPDNPDLVRDGGDVAHETDFRSVYATVLEDWLGADPIAILGADFRSSSLAIL